MKFYSGFGFKNEKDLFKDILPKNGFFVAGFSKGSIEAFEYVKNSKKRVDKLILISPAFFQKKDEKFKRLQLLSFKKDFKKYMLNFYKNVLYPSKIDIKEYQTDGDFNQLEKLLYYKWSKDSLKEIRSRGVDIEVYLGEKDKIINPIEAYDFFKSFATVYYIKNVGHILRG